MSRIKSDQAGRTRRRAHRRAGVGRHLAAVVLMLLGVVGAASMAVGAQAGAAPSSPGNLKSDVQDVNDPDHIARLLPGRSIVIAAVGDIIPHDTLQMNATEHPEHYQHLWASIRPILRSADMTYGNLETPLAEGVLKSGRVATEPRTTYDGDVYSGYPTFNAPPSFALALRAAGFTVVSTANNHAMDRHSIGVDRTIVTLRNAGLAFSGTRPARSGSRWPWSTVTERQGFRVGWLACTYGSNVSPRDHPQVLNCNQNRDEVLRELRDLRDRPDVDVVVFTPHFGEEYRLTATRDQRDLAHAAANAGADAVIGNHPHVPQPWELYQTEDKRRVPIAYSIGNFVSNQKLLNTRASFVLLLSVARDTAGRARLSGAGYLPILTHRYATDAAPKVPGEPAAWVSASFAHPGLMDGSAVQDLLTRQLGQAGRLSPEQVLDVTRSGHALPPLDVIPDAETSPDGGTAGAPAVTWAPPEGALTRIAATGLPTEGPTGLAQSRLFQAAPEGRTLLSISRAAPEPQRSTSASAIAEEDDAPSSSSSSSSQ